MRLAVNVSRAISEADGRGGTGGVKRIKRVFKFELFCVGVR